MIVLILRVAGRELRRIVRGGHLVALMVVAPVVLFISFGLIYAPRQVTDIPIAVVDLDGSAFSRSVVRALDATRALSIADGLAGATQARAVMQEGRIQGAVIIPAGAGATLKSGGMVTIVVLKNASNLIVSNLIFKDAVTVIRTFSAGVLLRRARAAGLSEAQALNVAAPLRVEAQSVYNPYYDYQFFLAPALMAAMLQMVILLAAAVAFNDDDGAPAGFRDLLSPSPGASAALVLGKSIPYLAVFSAVAISIPLFFLPVYGIDSAASSWSEVLLFLYFVPACFFPAFLLSCAVRDARLSTSAAVFIATPAFLLSGYTFPVWAMPDVHRTIAGLLPYTHFLNAFAKLYQGGGGIADILPELGALSWFIWPSLAACLLIMRLRLKQGDALEHA